MCCDTPAPHTPPAAGVKLRPAKLSAPRKPTTYELVERKKALQDLIKGLPHEDFREAEERKRQTIEERIGPRQHPACRREP